MLLLFFEIIILIHRNILRLQFWRIILFQILIKVTSSSPIPQHFCKNSYFKQIRVAKFILKYFLWVKEIINISKSVHTYTHTYKSENNEDYFQNKLNNTNIIMPSTIFNGFPPLHSLEPGAAVYPSRHLSQIAVVPPTEKVFSRHSSHLAAISPFLGIKK